MTAVEWTVLARMGLGAAGVLTFGAYAEVHVILALVLVGLWIHYAATADPRRVALFYVAGTTAGLVVQRLAIH